MQLRKAAGFAAFLGAGRAQGAAAGAYQKSVAALLPQGLHQAKGGGVVGSFSLLDGWCIGKVRDLPDGLQHQRLFMGEHLLLHLLRGAAVRRAGVVHAVLPAEVFLAVGAESRVKDDFRRVEYRCGGEALGISQGEHLFFCHFGFLPD